MRPETEIRQRLLHAGFSPLPLQGKLPVLKEWQKKFETNDGEIELWEKVYPHANNTGFLTQRTPTLDIDITDEPAARAVEDLIREKFEERGFFLVRFGRRPKRAIPFRTNDPFRKIICSLISPDGKREKIELLGDGQQLACFGIHPDTQQPYEWFGGNPGEIAHNDLPYISLDEARESVEAAGKLLIADFGYKPVDAQKPEAGPTLTGDGKPANWDQLFTNIIVGVELHDSMVQLSASMAAKGFPPGDVTRILKSLLASSDLPHDSRWQERFDDIDRTVKTAYAKYQPKTPVNKTIEILSLADFIKGFVPPDYLIEGMLQRRFIYSLCGPTGHAKTAVALLVARLVSCADPKPVLGLHPVEKGRVVYFVGENPDDVRMRVIGSAWERKQAGENPYIDNVSFIPGVFNIEAMISTIADDLRKHGSASLIIVDTSAAYFLGNEELSNTQMGNYARVLRLLTTLPGGPCVLVLTHPIKHALEPSQLLPRGGGAYLAEMDGNLTLWRTSEDTVELYYNKMRGPGFQPMSFRLDAIRNESLKDSKGRLITTVKAVPISMTEEEQHERKSADEEDQVLMVMLRMPGDVDGSLSRWATDLGWITEGGEPYKKRVERAIIRLHKSKLVTQRRNNKWTLTEEGKDAARKIAIRTQATPMRPADDDEEELL